MKSRLTSLLRWSEKYTKTDMVYLASRSGAGIVAQVITAVATLVFAVVVGHYLPKETYGEYKYVLSLIAILSLFSLNNMGAAVMQSTAQGFTGALRKGFWMNLRWSFAVFVGALVLALYYFWFHNPVLAAEILIGGMLSPFLASASLYSPFLAGKRDFLRQMFYSVVDNIVTTGIMVATVLLTHNPLVLVTVYFIANVLGALYFYRRTLQLYASTEEHHDAGMLTYSKHLSMMGILGGIVDTLDQVLLFHFAGAAQLAIFTFATALPDQIKTPIKTLDTMVQTGFANRTSQEIRSSMGHKMLWYFVFALFVIVSYITLAPFIFKFFFPAYMDSVIYSQIYILWVLAFTCDPAVSYFAARKKVYELYLSNIFFIVFQLVSMLIGVLYWGLLGLIVAQITTRLVSALVAYVLYQKVIRKDTTYA